MASPKIVTDPRSFCEWSEQYAFVVLEVARLGKAYSLPLPSVAILAGLLDVTKNLAFYDEDQETIILDSVFAEVWSVDVQKAKSVMCWIAAHEFFHHLVKYRHPVIWPKKVKGWVDELMLVKLEERRASLFALRETGMTTSEFHKSMLALIFKEVGTEEHPNI